MTTVGDIIDRIYRDYLLPPDEQPTRFTINGSGMNASTKHMPVDVSMLSPEEMDLLGPGAVIEAGSELLLVEAAHGASTDSIDALTVRRGMFGTEASPHPAGTIVTVAPDYPRQVVFDALADAIENLWPDLWTIRTTEFWASPSAIVELPADCEEIIEVRSSVGGGWAYTASWEFLSPYPNVPSGKALQFGLGGGYGHGYVVYKARTKRPQSEADTLESLNVDPSWVKVAAVGAVAHVVANEDIDRLTAEFITRALEVEGFTIGQGTDLRNGLLQYQQFLMEPLRRAVQARTPVSVVVHHML